jgi:hypothetical protein
MEVKGSQTVLKYLKPICYKYFLRFYDVSHQKRINNYTLVLINLMDYFSERSTLQLNSSFTTFHSGSGSFNNALVEVLAR